MILGVLMSFALLIAAISSDHPAFSDSNHAAVITENEEETKSVSIILESKSNLPFPKNDVQHTVNQGDEEVRQTSTPEISVDIITTNITTILSSMQSSYSADAVAQALYNHFHGVYHDKQRFLFYVLLGFDERGNSVLLRDNGKEFLKLLKGKVVNGIWTVYWASSIHFFQGPIKIDSRIMEKNLSSNKWLLGSLYRDPGIVLRAALSGSFEIGSRSPEVWFVVVFNDTSNHLPVASVGKTPQVDVFYKRFEIPGLTENLFRCTWIVDFVFQ